MIDISNAQLEPYRALHFFHERIDIHIKTATAGAILLCTESAQSTNPRRLGDLVEQSHPAWNNSPVHEIDVSLYRRLYGAAGSFGIVALFSSLDDFISGVEADIAKHFAMVCEQEPQSREGDNEEDRIFRVYERYGWDTGAISPLQPLIDYFRLIRNCIAHRSSRCSRQLSTLCDDPALGEAIRPLLDHTTPAHPRFAYNEEIFIEPTLAIACSDVLRKVGADCNRQYIEMIGVDSFLRIVAKNLLHNERPIRTAAHRSPEAVLNLALSERYRVPVLDRLEPMRELIRLGMWRQFVARYSAIYRHEA